jgi:hypothetical protein
MKEKTACIIGGMFAAAIIAFTALKMIPVEVFTGFAGLALAWLYKVVEDIRAKRRTK